MTNLLVRTRKPQSYKMDILLYILRLKMMNVEIMTECLLKFDTEVWYWISGTKLLYQIKLFLLRQYWNKTKAVD